MKVPVLLASRDDLTAQLLDTFYSKAFNNELGETQTDSGGGSGYVAWRLEYHPTLFCTPLYVNLKTGQQAYKILLKMV